MTPENFCYWLQGVFEVSNPQEMNKAQLDVVKEHLQLVFNKVTIKHSIGDVRIDKTKILSDAKTLTQEQLDKIVKNAKQRLYDKSFEMIDQIPHCKSDKLCSTFVEDYSWGKKWLENEAKLNIDYELKSDPPVYPLDLMNWPDGPPRSC